MQPVEDHVVGRVQRLADFLQNHAAFHGDFIVREHRVQQDVGDQLQRQTAVFGQHARVIGRHLARGVGVEVPAHVLYAFGDLQSGSRLGALERHVFKEMGDAVFVDAFMPRPRLHEDAERGGREARHVFSDDRKTVRQRVDADGQARMPFRMMV